MKLTVFATLFLVLSAGITIVHVESNTEISFQSLSKTELQVTRGASGSCGETVMWYDDDPGCFSTGCVSYWSGSGWVSKKRIAFTYAVCGGSTTNGTRCHKTHDKGQDCALEYHYAGPYCQSWFWDTETEYISTYNRTTVSDPGCDS